MSKRLAEQEEVENAVVSEDNVTRKKSKLDADGTHSTNVICNASTLKKVVVIHRKPDGKHQHAMEKTLTQEPSKDASLNGSTSGPVSASVKSGNRSNSPSSQPPLAANPADDSEYFASYGQLEIHRTMIDDSARTQAYRRAILTNYRLFYGKTVLDVGCGTGILSVFCCLAGARRVYAVEASGAAGFARLVAAENGFAERVQVLQCRVEDAKLPEKVDVIVSEWMGHALLYESMLDSVLVARDRWLRPGGAMFPERAVLKMALCTAPGLALETGASEFWRDVHGRFGVHMSCLSAVEEERRWRSLPVRVAALLPEDVHSHAATAFDLDLRTVLPVELRDHNLRASGLTLTSFGRAELTGLALWFDVLFPGGETLSTSPYAADTHWGQTVLPLETEVIEQGAVIRCSLGMAPDELHPRNWVFVVDLERDDAEEEQSISWVMDGTG